ncbi:Aste57867_22110 [Aphanomyces stellatus]|uniref:Membrane protein BRI3 n=1 Tax=Aphanomyces stellatus TaxID=120398 RepID=A0A485LJC3_9STRA|nr:hypothetical protein As57867_022041 [Aphanomyces stellatus]VFT98778.1 Aste57867_22110 [Aphanomyces stellatus]
MKVRPPPFQFPNFVLHDCLQYVCPRRRRRHQLVACPLSTHLMDISLVDNCHFDANAKDASFCSRCGAPLTVQANPAFQQHQQPGFQQQPGAYPGQYATSQPQVVQAVPLQQPQYVVVQSQPTVLANGEFIVVPGQILTATGCCAHAVQTNEFTCPGIVLGILFFPIGILCCLLLTERRCVHCGAILN